jgi:hypothetical protein
MFEQEDGMKRTLPTFLEGGRRAQTLHFGLYYVRGRQIQGLAEALWEYGDAR